MVSQRRSFVAVSLIEGQQAEVKGQRQAHVHQGGGAGPSLQFQR